MFISVLTVIYIVLVCAILLIYISRYRHKVLSWLEKKGLKNNFFIRILKGTPKTKNSDKEHVSKAFTDRFKS